MPAGGMQSGESHGGGRRAKRSGTSKGAVPGPPVVPHFRRLRHGAERTRAAFRGCLFQIGVPCLHLLAGEPGGPLRLMEAVDGIVNVVLVGSAHESRDRSYRAGRVPSNPNIPPIKRNYRQGRKNTLPQGQSIVHNRKIIGRRPLGISAGLSVMFNRIGRRDVRGESSDRRDCSCNVPKAGRPDDPNSPILQIL